MEIVKGLHRLESVLGNRKLFQHIFTGDRILVVDTGIRETPDTLIFPYLESLGRSPADITMALISHADADHFGGNEAIRRTAPAALLAAHAFDTPWVADPDRIMEERYNQFAGSHGMSYPSEVKSALRNMMGGPVPIDLQLRGGESILLEKNRPLQVLFLPGHTRGHIGIYDPVHHAAVLTDAVLWHGLPDVNGHIVMPPTYCHTETYRTTIQTVEHLDLEVLCLSHYEVLQGKKAIADFVAETRRFVERADEAILNGLAGGEWKTLKEVIAFSDPILGPFGEAAPELAYPLLGHLTEFTHQGRLEARIVDGITRWRRSG